MARLCQIPRRPSPLDLVLRTLNAVLFDGNLGTPTTGTLKRLSEGYKIVFKSDFTLSAGTVTGGTVTSFDVYFGPTKVLKARGYTVAIADALDAIDAATITGTETFNNLFFRNATVKGVERRELHVCPGRRQGSGSRRGRRGQRLWVRRERPQWRRWRRHPRRQRHEQAQGGRGRRYLPLFVPMGGADKVKDFSVKDDLVSLDPSLFDSVPVGPLADIYFHVGKTAKTPDHHIIYNWKAGGLPVVDEDGSRIQAQVQVAILPDHLKMKADNIFVADFF